MVYSYIVRYRTPNIVMFGKTPIQKYKVKKNIIFDKMFL